MRYLIQRLMNHRPDDYFKIDGDLSAALKELAKLRTFYQLNMGDEEDLNDTDFRLFAQVDVDIESEEWKLCCKTAEANYVVEVEKAKEVIAKISEFPVVDSRALHEVEVLIRRVEDSEVGWNDEITSLLAKVENRVV